MSSQKTLLPSVKEAASNTWYIALVLLPWHILPFIPDADAAKSHLAYLIAHAGFCRWLSRSEFEFLLGTATVAELMELLATDWITWANFLAGRMKFSIITCSRHIYIKKLAFCKHLIKQGDSKSLWTYTLGDAFVSSCKASWDEFSSQPLY
jgi:hypothetical protein